MLLMSDVNRKHKSIRRPHITDLFVLLLCRRHGEVGVCEITIIFNVGDACPIDSFGHFK